MKFLSRRTVLLASLAAASPAVALAEAAGANPGALLLLAASDRLRFPQEPFRATTTLVDYINGRAQEKVVLTVFFRIDPASRSYGTIVRYIAPERDAGKAVLYSGRDLWFYDPASRTSVRISPQQRLIGQAANGDVVTSNLSQDYSPTVVGSETVKDADHVDHACWHLDLAAKTSAATYKRSELWIDQADNQPVKARFYADSGRLLKIAYYTRRQSVLGAVRSTETVIIDAVDSRLITTITLDGYVAQAVPIEWFQRDFLPRLPLK